MLRLRNINIVSIEPLPNRDLLLAYVLSLKTEESVRPTAGDAEIEPTGFTAHFPVRDRAMLVARQQSSR
jgi:hypothetical protein